MESREFLFIVSNLSEFHDRFRFRQRQNGSLELCGKLTFLFGSFTLAQLLLVVDREQNQSASIFFEPLDIFLNAFNRLVAPTIINSNSDCLCKLWCDFCTLRENKKKNTTVDMSIRYLTSTFISTTNVYRRYRTSVFDQTKTQFAAFLQLYELILTKHNYSLSILQRRNLVQCALSYGNELMDI